MVALLGLGQPLHVRSQILFARPRGAVDPLELRVLLRAAPVCGGAARELERVADQLGVGQVRAAAQVLPRQLAAPPVVVVDRQLATADLPGGALDCVEATTVGPRVCPLSGVGRRVTLAALQLDELELVRLVGQLGVGVVVGRHSTREGLTLVDDLLHRPFERFEVVGRKGRLDVEVVVEAVADRRADAEHGLGVDLLHGLREHVGGRVAQHGEPVRRVDGHRLDRVAVGQDVGEIDEPVVDARHDDGSVATRQLEEVARGRALGHRSLAPGDGHGDLGRHGGALLTSEDSAGMPRARGHRQG